MLKFAILLDKTKVKSYYIKNNKCFNYFTHEPYQREHSVSNECQIGFWSYPVLFEGKMLNLNEFESLPDEEFDLIFLNLESSNPRFDFEQIKNKYNCKIYGIFKESCAVNQATQYNCFSKCEKIITGVYHQVNLFKRMYGNKVFYLPQPVNIDFLRKNFYIHNKENLLFNYLNGNHRSIYNITFAPHLSKTYNIELKANDPINKLNLEPFLRYFNVCKYLINLDTEPLSIGQQSCLCATLGVISLGGNSDAAYNLYPETYGIDFGKIEDFFKYLLYEKNRVEYEELVLDRLKSIYSYEIIKSKIFNLL